MSCEELCRKGVAQLGAGHGASPTDLAAIQAIYDAKPELQPGEDLATFRRQAKLLTTRFRQIGLKLPEHLDLDEPEGIVAIRYGRVYAELQRRGWLQKPALPPVGEADGATSAATTWEQAVAPYEGAAVTWQGATKATGQIVKIAMPNLVVTNDVLETEHTISYSSIISVDGELVADIVKQHQRQQTAATAGTPARSSPPVAPPSVAERTSPPFSREALSRWKDDMTRERAQWQAEEREARTYGPEWRRAEVRQWDRKLKQREQRFAEEQAYREQQIVEAGMRFEAARERDPSLTPEVFAAGVPEPIRDEVLATLQHADAHPLDDTIQPLTPAEQQLARDVGVQAGITPPAAPVAASPAAAPVAPLQGRALTLAWVATNEPLDDDQLAALKELEGPTFGAFRRAAMEGPRDRAMAFKLAALDSAIAMQRTPAPLQVSTAVPGDHPLAKLAATAAAGYTVDLPPYQVGTVGEPGAISAGGMLVRVHIAEGMQGAGMLMSAVPGQRFANEQSFVIASGARAAVRGISRTPYGQAIVELELLSAATHPGQ